MHSTHIRSCLLGASLVAAATLSACGGGSSGSTITPGPVSTLGTLSVALTDAPACGFDAVNVTVSKVRVNKSASAGEGDAGWTDIVLAAPKKLNLLDLTNGVLANLGEVQLEAGQYSQLRLVLDSNASANTVVPAGTSVEKPLETPSAAQSGLKLIGAMNVEAGQKTDVVIDFDACKSVVTRGGKGTYALKPVLKLLPTASANGINGFIATAALGGNVSVSAQQNGSIVSATTPNPTTGEFVLSRLAPGNYDVVITADNSAAAVVAAVPVASTSSVTALSTAAAPIQLAAGATGSIAGTVSMTPASTTEAAYVAAKQSFAAGPTVTIRYQGADLASGAYTIANLPVAAPQYATYSATLPLVFAASTGVTAGSYRVEASATGYTAKAVDGVSIATANQAGVDFSLAP